jgi:signal transduction histidine kinase
MLQEFIALNRDEIIRRCRGKVATRSTPPPAKAGIDHGVPMFLDQLGDALRHEIVSSVEISNSALQHGHDLLLQGYTVSQLVHVYGDVCQSITELALETNAPMSTDEFRTLNRCLDDAIAGAVTEFGRGQNQSTLDGETARGTERLGFFTHELGNLINTGIIAFEILKAGNVGVGGSTGAVLQRSLVGLRALVGRSLAELRLTEGIQNREPFLLGGFIDEIGPGATLEAATRRIKLTVLPVETGVTILADRQVLAAVVTNLLQNAFKFTRPGTSVILRVGASEERVLIEIQDECGGLPGGNVTDLFHPFEQRGTDRTGVGLGLAFCRWAVEANDGRIYARNLPGTGCVFTVDLPRVVAHAVAAVGSGVTAD